MTLKSNWARMLMWAIGAVVALMAATFVAFKTSPWPSVLVIRYVFKKGADEASKALEKHIPSGIEARLNERYDPADPDGHLDVYFPAATGENPLTTVVWVHGGGWVSGSKDDIRNYAKVLAGRGFTVVSVDYSVAPGAIFPTPIRQVNAALGYLAKNAARLRVDPNRIVLAGDSGGAHIVAVTANAIAAPAYAKALGIAPSIPRPQLVGMLLFCGPYSADGLNFDGPFGGFLKTVLWSFSGTKDFRSNKDFALAWVNDHVTGDFPPSFISAGNADPLLQQSVALAETLTRRGVRVERLFFEKDYKPPLPHEYQFNLDGEAGRLALERSVAFLKSLGEAR